jgi:hypothetical protein
VFLLFVYEELRKMLCRWYPNSFLKHETVYWTDKPLRNNNGLFRIGLCFAVLNINTI